MSSKEEQEKYHEYHAQVRSKLCCCGIQPKLRSRKSHQRPEGWPESLWIPESTYPDARHLYANYRINVLHKPEYPFLVVVSGSGRLELERAIFRTPRVRDGGHHNLSRQGYPCEGRRYEIAIRSDTSSRFEQRNDKSPVARQIQFDPDLSKTIRAR